MHISAKHVRYPTNTMSETLRTPLSYSTHIELGYKGLGTYTSMTDQLFVCKRDINHGREKSSGVLKEISASVRSNLQ